MLVVRAGVRATPPVAPPPTLLPLLRFRTLPAAAHDTVVVALDADAELRARVAEDLTERGTGRVGWLWLTRPAGWDTELRHALGELADDGAPNADDTGTDAQLRRRLAGAERAAARAELRAVRAEEQLARTRDQLDALRAEHDRLRGDAEAHEARAASLHDERTRAVTELKRIEKLLVRRDEERRVLQDRIAALETRLAEAAPPRAGDTATAAAVSPDPRDLRALAMLADRVERAIGDAALHLDALRAEAGLPAAGDSAGHGPGDVAGAPAVARTATPRRRPLRMPRGLTDDTVEAAAWLLTERPVLLVDGYNVSMAAWPDADIAEQRQRLVRNMADLAARTPGLGIEVVFDGATTDASPAALPARTGVNVRFTAPDVEADDELLAMIARYPHPRPVVVVSSDRRVRDGARRRSANVLSAHQLLAVARG